MRRLARLCRYNGRRTRRSCRPPIEQRLQSLTLLLLHHPGDLELMRIEVAGDPVLDDAAQLRRVDRLDFDCFAAEWLDAERRMLPGHLFRCGTKLLQTGGLACGARQPPEHDVVAAGVLAQLVLELRLDL